MEYLVHDGENFTHYASADALVNDMLSKLERDNGPSYSFSTFAELNALSASGFDDLDRLKDYVHGEPDVDAEDGADFADASVDVDEADAILSAVLAFRDCVQDNPAAHAVIRNHYGDWQALCGEDAVVSSLVMDAGNGAWQYVAKDVATNEVFALCRSDDDADFARLYGFLPSWDLVEGASNLFLFVDGRDGFAWWINVTTNTDPSFNLANTLEGLATGQIDPDHDFSGEADLIEGRKIRQWVLSDERKFPRFFINTRLRQYPSERALLALGEAPDAPAITIFGREFTYDDQEIG